MSKKTGTFEIYHINPMGEREETFGYRYHEEYPPKEVMIDLWIQLFRSCQFWRKKYREEAATHIKGNSSRRLMFFVGDNDTYISEDLRHYND